MTGSMCVSMTGRPTFAQRQNEQRRQSYGYYQTAKAIKEGGRYGNQYQRNQSHNT